MTHKERLHNKFNEQAMVLSYHCLQVVTMIFLIMNINGLFLSRPSATAVTLRK